MKWYTWIIVICISYFVGKKAGQDAFDSSFDQMIKNQELKHFSSIGKSILSKYTYKNKDWNKTMIKREQKKYLDNLLVIGDTDLVTYIQDNYDSSQLDSTIQWYMRQSILSQ